VQLVELVSYEGQAGCFLARARLGSVQSSLVSRAPYSAGIIEENIYFGNPIESHPSKNPARILNSEISYRGFLYSRFKNAETGLLKKEIGNTGLGSGISVIGNRLSGFLNRNTEKGKEISVFGKRITPIGKHISEFLNLNTEKGKEISVFGKQITPIGKRISELVIRVSVFLNRVSLIVFRKADIRFIKSFFADFLHSSDFSFTTSCIRHRNREFRLPISEIIFQARRGT